ncbi:MAG TPA: Gfo/Idh/MocA family oxidoreductase [Chthoniobacteraceae bacterium]|nr:Gfo/Idh/MocA family oxidoreductase [Chthoniobacteraceae bacterium]
MASTTPLPSHTATPPASAKPIRLGIIGLGYRSISGVLIEEIRPAFEKTGGAFEIPAVCDVEPRKQQAAVEKISRFTGKKPETFASYEEMLDHGELDAVYIAGPNDLHAPMAIAALRRGVDVLCEKPVATTLADADAIAAEAHQRIVAFFMQMHYRRKYHRVAELIRSGRIGEPVMTWCTEFRAPFPRWMNWVADRNRSGGALVEKNCHHCDILDLWTGSRPHSVYATGGQKKYATLWGQPSSIVDHAWITFDYENGVKGMIGINFTQSHRHQREFGVAGTEGLIRFDLKDGEKLHITTNNGDTELLDCPGELRGGVFLDFLNCVRSRTEPLVSFEKGRRSLLVPLAAERSIREKRVVLISEIDPRP